MKTRIYLRVAKSSRGYKVMATTKPNNEPLYNQGYRGGKDFLPTVAFGVDFVIPDELFSKAVKVVGEINIALENASIAADVPIIGNVEQINEDSP
jgi:hypothetical protein